MQGKNLLEGRTGPVTQSVDAVKALLSWKGHPVNPLPADVSMDNGRLVLVLSNKRDAYYTTTATKCSCPAATYNQGPCKHIRKHFKTSMPAPMPATSEPLIQRGGFKPFDEMPGEEKAKGAA